MPRGRPLGRLSTSTHCHPRKYNFSLYRSSLLSTGRISLSQRRSVVLIHTQLHPKGENGARFAQSLFARRLARGEGAGSPLCAHFDSIRWVFPDAPYPNHQSGVFNGREWFTMNSRTDPDDNSEAQQPSLQGSLVRLRYFIEFEIDRVPAPNIFIGGLEQGMAMALAAFLSEGQGDYAGFIGLSG